MPKILSFTQDADFYYQLAKKYLNENELSECILNIKKAIYLTKNAKYFEFLGDVLAKTGNESRAMSYLYLALFNVDTLAIINMFKLRDPDIATISTQSPIDAEEVINLMSAFEKFAKLGMPTGNSTSLIDTIVRSANLKGEDDKKGQTGEFKYINVLAEKDTEFIRTALEALDDHNCEKAIYIAHKVSKDSQHYLVAQKIILDCSISCDDKEGSLIAYDIVKALDPNSMPILLSSYNIMEKNWGIDREKFEQIFHKTVSIYIKNKDTEILHGVIKCFYIYKEFTLIQVVAKSLLLIQPCCEKTLIANIICNFINGDTALGKKQLALSMELFGLSYFNLLSRLTKNKTTLATFDVILSSMPIENVKFLKKQLLSAFDASKSSWDEEDKVSLIYEYLIIGDAKIVFDNDTIKSFLLKNDSLQNDILMSIDINDYNKYYLLEELVFNQNKILSNVYLDKKFFQFNYVPYRNKNADEVTRYIYDHAYFDIISEILDTIDNRLLNLIVSDMSDQVNPSFNNKDILAKVIAYIYLSKYPDYPLRVFVKKAKRKYSDFTKYLEVYCNDLL